MNMITSSILSIYMMNLMPQKLMSENRERCVTSVQKNYGCVGTIKTAKADNECRIRVETFFFSFLKSINSNGKQVGKEN